MAPTPTTPLPGTSGELLAPPVTRRAATGRNRPSLDDLVTTAADALDVFDMERVAETTVPTAHFGYIQTGVDGEETQRNNRAALEAMYIRARRLVDVSRLDTRVTLFGREWPSPVIVAPCGSQRGFHDEGELATARAAQAQNHLQVLSSVSSTGVEAVNEARGEPVWYQLYATSNWAVTEAIVSRGFGKPAALSSCSPWTCPPGATASRWSAGGAWTTAIAAAATVRAARRRRSSRCTRGPTTAAPTSGRPA